ncbi:CD63 antigen-like [Bradysia coprophila]|uniref:CD63 antigen-like n=1 Tax=Bradysia coprophila TaxID=38358 RepID=UPI00187D7898|nr:CD63 antigen-like [Bradysia coprophila]
MKVSKFFVIILNLCLLVLSVTMISSSTSLRFILGDFYFVLTKGNDIGGLNITWIASGFVLLALGVFGMWSALKESAFMMNLYTTILSLTLILQIVTATTSNKLNGQLDYIVSHSIQNLMVQYGYNVEYASIMDSIQMENSCCGYNGPSDWQSYGKQTTKRTTKRDITTEPSEHYELLEESFSNIEDDSSAMAERSLKKPSPPTPPISCCTSVKKCKNYYSRGCFKVLYREIARVVFMAKTVAMISSVLQIFGILAAYIFGKTLSV